MRQLVPELTRSAAINLNTRLRLPPAVVILSSSPAARRPLGNASYAIRGRHFTKREWWPRPRLKTIWRATQTDNHRLDRQLLDIFARDCFEFYLWGKQAKPIRGKDQSLKPSALRVTRRHRENAVAHGQEFDAEPKREKPRLMLGSRGTCKPNNDAACAGARPVRPRPVTHFGPNVDRCMGHIGRPGAIRRF